MQPTTTFPLPEEKQKLPHAKSTEEPDDEKHRRGRNQRAADTAATKTHKIVLLVPDEDYLRIAAWCYEHDQKIEALALALLQNKVRQ